MTDRVYTREELANYLNVDKATITRRSQSQHWPFKEQKTRGGRQRLYYHSGLPATIQKQILSAEVKSLNTSIGEATSLSVIDDSPRQVDALTDAERKTMEARLAILSMIDELMVRHDIKRNAAIRVFLEHAKAGELSDDVIALLKAANARSGNQRLAGRATIYRWFDKRDLGSAAEVAPRKAPKKGPPSWLPELLALYQRFPKPGVAELIAKWDQHYSSPAPAVRTAQRHIKQIPVEIREHGRLGKSAMRAVLPFVRRTTDGLWPMDVVTVDGHLFKAYVRHPMTGRRFRPEVTTYLDVATRKAVGFSAWLAESQMAIWAALREMVANPECGVPAIHYSDNGAYRGEQHRTTLARIGTTPMFSEAYRAQARGIIERLNSSVWVPLAKSMPLYAGKEMDQEAFKRELKIADADGSNLMAWDDFIATCYEALDAYNNSPHSSLKKKTPNEAWEAAVSEGWQPTLLENDDLHDLLPHQERKVIRGEVRLPWGRYSAPELSLWHGQHVRVGFHPTDGSRAWVSDHHGVLICVAERGANERPYVPESQLDHARAEREKGRLARLERKAEAIREEGAAQFEIPPSNPVDPQIHAETVAAVESEQPQALETDGRKYHAMMCRLMKRLTAGEPIRQDEQERCERYFRSPESQSYQEFFESFGLDPETYGLSDAGGWK